MIPAPSSSYIFWASAALHARRGGVHKKGRRIRVQARNWALTRRYYNGLRVGPRWAYLGDIADYYEEKQ